MIEVPPRATVDMLRALDPARTVVWASARGAAWWRANGAPVAPVALGTGCGPTTKTVVVIGGGALLDEAKLARRSHAPAARLVAVPTIWGSGAEASPVAVVSRDGTKVIDVDTALCPDAVLHDPAFAATVPVARAREACGDVWAHALEGFASPLASFELRADLAVLVRALLVLPLGPDPRWFAAGEAACAGQARSGVGLVHGMAHVLEETLADPAWHHARLCAAVLLPVITFDCTTDKWPHLFTEHGVPLEDVLATARELFDATAWRELIPAIVGAWPRIIRDPLTRTNAAMVRPGSLAFFEEFAP